MAMNQLAAQRDVVIGASGFIGLHLYRDLLRSGAEVFAICRTEPGISHERLHWRQAKVPQKAFRGFHRRVVFHLCSYAQGEKDLAMALPTFHGELVTSVNVLKAVADIGGTRIILAGSMEEPKGERFLPLPTPLPKPQAGRIERFSTDCTERRSSQFLRSGS